MSDFLSAAITYAEAGLRVFPLKPKGKQPLPGTHGCTDGTTDKNIITSWWSKVPAANIGLCTGRTASGKYLVVIDLDEDEGKDKHGITELQQYLTDKSATFPPTLEAVTGRNGRHLAYFTDEEIRNTTDLLPGIDVRGEGGYIVAAPSVHPNGNVYRWKDSAFTPDGIAQADEAVISFLKQERKKTVKAANVQSKPVPQPVPLDVTGRIISRLGLSFDEGSRNDSLFRFACSLNGQGYEDSAIKDLTERCNAEHCAPPLSDSELTTLISSALSKPKGVPRTVESVGGNFAAYEENISQKYPFIVPRETKDGDITYSVSCTKLAAYIRKNERFFFLESHGEKPLLFLYSGGRYQQISDNKFKSVIKRPVETFSKDLVRTRDIDEVFKLLATDGNTRKVSELDDNEELINFQNGLLNVRTLELIPHTPDIISTIQIPCNWNTAAAGKAPVFTRYLNTLTDDKDAKDAFQSKLLLLEYLGFVISNVKGYRAKKSLFLCGAGDTGKSQFLELAVLLVGEENYFSLEMSELEERFGTSKLWRKRLVGSPDISFTPLTELKIYKKLTGGDRISFEHKGKDAFTDRFNGLLIFCGNTMPRFGGDKGDHVYRRMIVLTCNNVIPEEQQDGMIVEKMYAEREAIVYDAVCAFRKIAESGTPKLTIPQKCTNCLERFKVENNNVLMFLEECTQPITESKFTKEFKQAVTTGAVYRCYTYWAKNSGEKTVNRQVFRSIIANYYKLQKSTEIDRKYNGNWYYRFFTLTQNAMNENGY